jgi:hypothetical protein
MEGASRLAGKTSGFLRRTVRHQTEKQYIGVYCLVQQEDWGQCLVVVNTVANFSVPRMAGNYWKNSDIIGVPEMTLWKELAPYEILRHHTW